MNNFEETFSQWEFELNKYERDNGQALPESVKIAVILNETKGPLQQHLQLLAGQTPNYNQVRTTIMEYYRATTAFNKLKQQTSSSIGTNQGGGIAPMDISAVKGKGYKGYKGKRESTKEKAKEKVRATEDTRAKEKETRVTTMEKVQLDLVILLDTKDNNKAKVKEKDTKENKHKTCAIDVDNQDILQRIVEFQSTITQRHHKPQQNNMTCKIGTMIHTRMMDIGGTIAADNHEQDGHQHAQQLALPAPQICNIIR